METFSLVGALFVSAAYTAIVSILMSCSHASIRQKWTIATVAAAWGILIVAIAVMGGFAPGIAGPVPMAVLAFAGLLVLLFGSWFFIPLFRAAILSVPLSALVALNAARIGGVLFLILAAEGRLSDPFASSAGWGDIITGVLAIPLAILLFRGIQKIWAHAWNAFGMLDLVVAVLLGLFSAPGTPFYIFNEGPGTAVMTELPWLLIPSILVPIYLFIHFVITVKLKLPTASLHGLPTRRD